MNSLNPSNSYRVKVEGGNCEFMSDCLILDTYLRNAGILCRLAKGANVWMWIYEF